MQNSNIQTILNRIKQLRLYHTLQNKIFKNNNRLRELGKKTLTNEINSLKKKLNGVNLNSFFTKLHAVKKIQSAFKNSSVLKLRRLQRLERERREFILIKKRIRQTNIPSKARMQTFKELDYKINQLDIQIFELKHSLFEKYPINGFQNNKQRLLEIEQRLNNQVPLYTPVKKNNPNIRR
jgi:hypothetical protein